MAGLVLGAAAVNATFGVGNIVLPEVARGLHVQQGPASLFIAMYGLALASVLIMGGRLGDRHGRKRIFTVGLIAFAAASMLVSLAPNLVVLLIFRMMQGVAAGMLLPQVISTIQVTTTGVARTRALAIYTAAVAGGTTVGQALGGAIVSANLFGLGWRPAFWFLAVLAVASALLVRGVPETTSTSHGQDRLGSLILAAAMTALLVPLALGKNAGWPWWIWVLFGLAAVTFVVFWWWENRVPVRTALVPPQVLRHRPLVASVLMTMLFFAGYGGFSYVIALTFEEGLGYSPRTAGIALVPFALAFLIGALLLPPWIAKVGAIRLMIIGGAGQLTGLVTLAAVIVLSWPDPSQAIVQPLLVVIGIFQTMMFTPLLGVFVASVPTEHAGLSGGLFSTIQQLALAVGVAVLGLVFGLVEHVSIGVAFAACLLIQATFAAGFALLSRTTVNKEGPLLASVRS